MKLKNKKTGKIYNLNEFCLYDNNGFAMRPFLKSLAELNEEWEDVPEEPKGCWIINIFGVVEYTHFRNGAEAELLKEIGNYFETEEEAEKAVDKLKARTRLINHGLCLKLNKFQDLIKYKFKTGCISSEYDAEEALKDLDLLFGGEE